MDCHIKLAHYLQQLCGLCIKLLKNSESRNVFLLPFLCVFRKTEMGKTFRHENGRKGMAFHASYSTLTIA